MPVSLPTSPGCQSAQPFLHNFGGDLVPFLGGPVQTINRLGTRFGVRVTMPPLASATDGRLFVSRLVQAKTDRLLMLWPALDYPVGTPGAPKVRTATSGGMTLPIKGATAGYTFVEGQFFSIIHGGRRYVHMASSGGVADGSGNLDLSIYPMLRTNLSVNDVIEVAQPMIEGCVQPGDELNWEAGMARRTAISFSVVEAA